MSSSNFVVSGDLFSSSISLQLDMRILFADCNWVSSSVMPRVTVGVWLSVRLMVLNRVMATARKLLEEGMTKEDVAKQFNIGVSTLYRLLKNSSTRKRRGILPQVFKSLLEDF